MESTFKRNCSALINTDDVGLVAYKAKKEQNRKVNEIVHDINTIKTEFEEIKSLLRQLITKE